MFFEIKRYSLLIKHKTISSSLCSFWLKNISILVSNYGTILYSGSAWVGVKDLSVDKYAKDIPHLDKYALERWEVRLTHLISILHVDLFIYMHCCLTLYHILAEMPASPGTLQSLNVWEASQSNVIGVCGLL